MEEFCAYYHLLVWKAEVTTTIRMEWIHSNKYEESYLGFHMKHGHTFAFLQAVESRTNSSFRNGLDDVQRHRSRPSTKTIEKTLKDGQATTQQESQRHASILSAFPNVISKEGEKQSVTKAPYKRRITTGNSLPVYVRDCRWPLVEKDQMQKEVETMLEKGIFEPSQSDWGAHLLSW